MLCCMASYWLVPLSGCWGASTLAQLPSRASHPLGSGKSSADTCAAAATRAPYFSACGTTAKGTFHTSSRALTAFSCITAFPAAAVTCDFHGSRRACCITPALSAASSYTHGAQGQAFSGNEILALLHQSPQFKQFLTEVRKLWPGLVQLSF